MISRNIFMLSAAMAILCILKRMSNVVKSVCNFGPTISLSLRKTPVEGLPYPPNTMRNLSPFLLGAGQCGRSTNYLEHLSHFQELLQRPSFKYSSILLH
ncbi:hypothetical protein CEXT_105251 [Caerostris extrusa]|uniref:Secreted protein n=1 Tax=Caerostris extrusa TaxID=172846 RepID=A0AAV4TDQ3_CAEEX|nr:hypothetical protein CEXT_105251 [Caerostris extrusa]